MGELIEVTKRNGLRLLVDPDDKTPAIQELLRDWRERQSAAESPVPDLVEAAPEVDSHPISGAAEPAKPPKAPEPALRRKPGRPPKKETRTAVVKRKPGRPRKG